MTQELLGRVHRELIDVLNSINQDEIHHDGDDFHELLNDVEKALAQPEQEPVAWMDADGNISDNNDHKCFPIPLYTTPPQRTWVGLTDEEIRNWWRIENGLEDCDMAKLADFTLAVRAVELKLREKNT